MILWIYLECFDFLVLIFYETALSSWKVNYSLNCNKDDKTLNYIPVYSQFWFAKPPCIKSEQYRVLQLSIY